MKTLVKEVKDVQKVNALNVIEVQTRLDKETAQTAVTKEQKRMVKTETINLIAENLESSLKELDKVKFVEREHKTDFNRDFAKREDEYKGVFALFNILTKGKSNNSLNKAFYENKLDVKFKYGKEYNGLFMLAYVDTLDLIGQLRNPQKFTTSQFKRAFKAFNENCKSFEAFEKAQARAKKLNELIGAFKNTSLSAADFIEGLKAINKRNFNEKESLKIASYIYAIQIKDEVKK